MSVIEHDRTLGAESLDRGGGEAVLFEHLAGVLAVDRGAGQHGAGGGGELDRQAQGPDRAELH